VELALLQDKAKILEERRASQMGGQLEPGDMEGVIPVRGLLKAGELEPGEMEERKISRDFFEKKISAKF
jgi:hypothetical protein